MIPSTEVGSLIGTICMHKIFISVPKCVKSASVSSILRGWYKIFKKWQLAMKNVAGSKKRFSKGRLLREQDRENTDKSWCRGYPGRLLDPAGQSLHQTPVLGTEQCLKLQVGAYLCFPSRSPSLSSSICGQDSDECYLQI